MSKVSQFTVEGREAIGPWNFAARIPDGASARDYAFAPLVVATLVGGLGVFLGSDVADKVPFWSNMVVWITLVLSALGILLSVRMFFMPWVWTAPQMALFSVAGLAPVLWAFQVGPLVAFVLYSDAPLVARISIVVAFLAWHGWWIRQTAKRSLFVWSNVASREKVWVHYDCATVYRQLAAKSAMNDAGIAWYPGPMGILLPFLMCVPVYLYRHQIVSYLDVPWIPMVGFVLGLPVFVVCTTALTFAVVAMLVIPARILASTGRPVLVDMMTPVNAP